MDNLQGQQFGDDHNQGLLVDMNIEKGGEEEMNFEAEEGDIDFEFDFEMDLEDEDLAEELE